MSMVFRFRMLSDENDYFIREYEVPSDMNLVEFNTFLCKDMRFDIDSVTSFFMSNALWEKEREFTHKDMSAPGPEDDHEVPTPMNKVDLSQIIQRNRDRLIFLFDIFNNREMFLELIEMKKRENGIKYPRVTHSKADPPNQYNADGSDFFDEMMNDFDSFESDEAENELFDN